MVLGKLPVPGRPTIWITVGQGPTALAVGAGGGCLDIFTLICSFSPLSPSLWETARYRLKYCLKGPLNPKQPTNQPDIILLCQPKSLKQDSRVTCLFNSLRPHKLVYALDGTSGGILKSHRPSVCAYVRLSIRYESCQP